MCYNKRIEAIASPCLMFAIRLAPIGLGVANMRLRCAGLCCAVVLAGEIIITVTTRFSVDELVVRRL